MLFNSVEFLFAFLPCTLLGFFLIGRWHERGALLWITAASLFFYAWWNPVWLPLLLASIAGNLAFARWIARLPANTRERSSRRRVLAAAIVCNLALLVHYKYAAFFGASLAAITGQAVPFEVGELPLGISFFTFTQIAFLVDVHQRRSDDFDPLRYGLFVTYYPHLIAGPILHHKEMMPQFARADIFRFEPGRVADGSVVFILGLFKKTVMADPFGGYASAGFDAAITQPLSFYEAWGAALAYTLQLYFDFSGYSDMAIGLAMMIGVRLPLNFHSPYKASSITEFWRRWHMTLSRFLRDYLYIPLGGNRRGVVRTRINLMVTMLLGGLWHGAGWTFVAWGALHGALLVLHQGWRSVAARLPGTVTRRSGWWAPVLQPVAWAMTFLAVVVGWVFFRAADVPTALSMLESMAGRHGALLPQQLIDAVPALDTIARGAGKVPHLADGTVMGAVEMLVMLCLGLGLVVGAPSMFELSNRARYVLVVPCAALALQRVLYGSASPFLYFQF
jgi:alginate O-acetyltransferase complex protein AlgI